MHRYRGVACQYSSSLLDMSDETQLALNEAEKALSAARPAPMNASASASTLWPTASPRQWMQEAKKIAKSQPTSHANSAPRV